MSKTLCRWPDTSVGFQRAVNRDTHVPQHLRRVSDPELLENGLTCKSIVEFEPCLNWDAAVGVQTFWWARLPFGLEQVPSSGLEDSLIQAFS